MPRFDGENYKAKNTRRLDERVSAISGNLKLSIPCILKMAETSGNEKPKIVLHWYSDSFTKAHEAERS